MKRGISTLTSILASMAVLVSCGTLRHAAPDPVSKQELDSYAHDHFFMEGIKMYNEEQYDAAMDLMAHSLEYDTASAATCYNLAQYYMSMHDRVLLEKYSGKAESLLQRAVRLEPDNYWYRRLLAMNYMRQGRQAEAILQYEDMTRRFPGNTEVLLTLASLYDDAGEFEKELRVLKRYGKLEDVADELKFQRFACYLQMNELDSAYYEADNPGQIIELLMNTTRDMIENAQSQLAEPYKQKSVAYFWMGQNDEALDVLTKGLSNVETASDKAVLFNLRGDFYHTLGQKAQMYADYDSTLYYEPDNINVLNNYAYFMSLDDRDLKKALSMSAKTWVPASNLPGRGA